jgi:hypothetical protein
MPDYLLGALQAGAMIILALLFAFPDIPYPILWQSAAAACLIGSLSPGLFGTKKNNINSNPQGEETSTDVNEGQPAGFSALIHTIRQEARANRDEE